MEQVSQPIELGRYRLLRRIAAGGMAEIWLAIQRGPHGFEKTAVLKVILPTLSENREFIQMFLDEARLAAGLDHDNIVRIYDFGEVEGRFFIAMEHLPGEDLASVISNSRQQQRPISLEAACDIIVRASAGLQFAHDLVDSTGAPLNVVHRDVSPSNIIVTYHGRVKVVDFGIARAASNITKTAAGVLKGKLAYVSPEQATGEPLDRRSDVFALGTVLYELLTLTRPFKRENELATLKAVLEEEIAPPSRHRAEVPPALDAIILKAMARDRSRRFQSAAELAEALSTWLVSQGSLPQDRTLATMLAERFDEERRNGKLRIAKPVLEPSARTPSQLKNLPAILTPIRSGDWPVHGERPATESINPTVELDALDLVDVEVVDAQRRLTRSALKPAITAMVVLMVGVASFVRFVACHVEPAGPVELNRPDAALPVAEVLKVDGGVLTDEAPRSQVIGIDAAVPVSAPVQEVIAPKGSSRPSVPKGRLTLDTEPYTQVFIRGKRVGDTPLVEHPLPVGIHTVTLINEEWGIKQTIEVEVSAGVTTEKRLKL